MYEKMEYESSVNTPRNHTSGELISRSCANHLYLLIMLNNVTSLKCKITPCFQRGQSPC